MDLTWSNSTTVGCSLEDFSPALIRNLDMDSAKTLIHRHEQAIALLNNDVEGLQRSIRQLEFRKMQHQAAIARCKGMITLAKRMPLELLAVIFEKCAEDGWTRTPLVVSHVCSQWRKAAKTPSVWSHLYVDFDNKDPLPRTRFWLEMAQTTQLYVTLNVGSDALQILPTMDLLVSRMSQWRTLIITSDLLIHTNNILSLCMMPSPILRTVNIYIREDLYGIVDPGVLAEDNHELTGFRNAFPDAPHLNAASITRNIFLSIGILPVTITNLSLNFPSERTFSRLSMSPVVGVLKGLSSIQQFAVTLPPSWQEELIVEESEEEMLVDLLALHTLTLSGPANLFGLLLRLHTPSLQRLHLRLSNNPSGYPNLGTGRVLREFVARGSPPLEILDLRDVDIPVTDFSYCLAGLPCLKELRLHESDIPDVIFDEMNGPDGLCPLLEKLDLRWCGQVSGRSLVRLIRSRTEPHTIIPSAAFMLGSIREITVINCSYIKETDVIDMAETTVCRVVMHDAEDYCRTYNRCGAPEFALKKSFRSLWMLSE
ncbi:hypothetical protein BDQ12DRAFT_675297 [Crucibulum laeve]|uniref:Uncharacterized protein n=1 Tax=Crucibulum laeve TaxID=68775 RepID=A0A5C3MFD3_9AGAR|nr:hypothetical protein BDQ12DRAFT_675297 [Crucibulum laeve]